MLSDMPAQRLVGRSLSSLLSGSERGQWLAKLGPHECREWQSLSTRDLEAPAEQRRSAIGSVRSDPWLRAAVGLVATISVFCVLYSARSVFGPTAAALFIIAVVWPMQSRLQARMPKLCALAIVILAIAVAFAVFASLVVWSFGRIGRSLATDADHLQQLYGQLSAWLESHGVGVAALWSEHFNARSVVRLLQGIAGRVYAMLGFWLVVLVYVILGLLEVDDAARRVQSLRNGEAALVVLEGSRRTAERLRKYLLIRTVMSVATGMLVWALAALAGLPLAADWGIIAFTLNYIPFIGPFIATMFPTLFALTHFSSWQSALVLFACLNIIQFVIGSYIEPRVSGSALSVSPFIVLFAVFFWTYMWGLFGAFIGVPITIAVLTFCALHPSTRWLAHILGRGPTTRSGEELP
jgi:AI-2 transport protein TqsA